MASRRVNDSKSSRSRQPPARTPEARENQLISLAIDTAEEQMRNGTASSQVITHFLKLGSTRERLEQEKLRVDTGLSEKKIETLESATRVEELMTEAISAFRSYAGQEPQDNMGELED